MSKYSSADIIGLRQLFAKSQFCVPVYQRSFSWEDKQVRDLWDDLLSGIKHGQDHHFGTIVLKEVEGPSASGPQRVYDVVDGQQRITAIAILVLALYEASKNKKTRGQLLSTYIEAYGDLRLRLGGANGEYLPKLVNEARGGAKVGNAKRPTNRRLRLAFTQFRVFVKRDLRSTKDRQRAIQYLGTQFKVLKVVIHDGVAAIRMFQSLNDRGKPLSVLDRTKSHLMLVCANRQLNRSLVPIQQKFEATYSAFDQIRQDGRAIRYIQRLSEDELLRFQYHYSAASRIRATPIKQQKPYSYRPSVEEIFNDYVKGMCSGLKSKKKLRAFVTEYGRDLKGSAQALQRLVSRAKKQDTELHTLLHRQQPNAAVYPLLIALETRGFLDEAFIDLVRVLDMRVYKVLRTAPKAGLYRDVVSQVKRQTDTAKLFNACADFVNGFGSDTILDPSLRGPMDQLEWLHFLFWEYERVQHESDTGPFPGKWSSWRKSQLEHILPRKPSSFDYRTCGFKDEEDYHEHVGTLGNLCILEGSLNKSAGNKPPNRKARYYYRSKLPGMASLGAQCEGDGFSKRVLVRRTTAIVRFVKRHWAIPKKR